MSIHNNRLVEILGLRHPIVSAPMALAAGGALAGAVSRAGGLGLIGGGYGDSGWLETQFEAARGAAVGVGFITWSLHKSPQLLGEALKHTPVAVMLSFGDPRPFANEIRAAGAKLICQCQNMDHIKDAVEAGADVIIAQGSEAGGHGAARATFTFVPEVADYLARHAPDTCLLAAGGVSDGRGLAAAQMLGADGVLIGTRFWASEEALVHARHHAVLLQANGDDTVRTTIADIARQLDWPKGMTARIWQNDFTRRWHGNEDALKRNLTEETAKYSNAFKQGDPDNAGVWFGEAAGTIDRIQSVAEIVEHITTQARQLLHR